MKFCNEIIAIFMLMQNTADKETEPHVGLKHIAHDALHDLVHFDSKLFRTLPALLFKPGKVTERSLFPGQDTYVKPFALFVFLNFLFFVVKSGGLFEYTLDSYQDLFGGRIFEKASVLHISTVILKERFDMAMRFEQKEYFVVMVPLFALVLQLLYWVKKRGFGVHLVFALNFYAFFIVFLIVVPYILIPVEWQWAKLNTGINLFYSENSLIVIIFATCFVYLAVSLRRVYHDRLLAILLRSGILSLTVLVLITVVYRTLLFFIVLHTVGE